MMLNDSIQMTAKCIQDVSQQSCSLDWWMIAAIIELIIIVVLLFARRGNVDNKKSIKRRVMKDAPVNFDNIIASSFGSKALYDELIRACHPDRFEPDKQKVAIANEITRRLGKYKFDLEKLKEIRKEAINDLNINL